MVPPKVRRCVEARHDTIHETICGIPNSDRTINQDASSGGTSPAPCAARSAFRACPSAFKRAIMLALSSFAKRALLLHQWSGRVRMPLLVLGRAQARCNDVPLVRFRLYMHIPLFQADRAWLARGGADVAVSASVDALSARFVSRHRVAAKRRVVTEHT